MEQNTAEKIFALAYLLQFGLCDEKELDDFINECFNKAPENDLYLELEWNSGDLEKVFTAVDNYFCENGGNYDIFAVELFKGIRRAYYKTEDILLFDRQLFNLWEAVGGYYDHELNEILYKAIDHSEETAEDILKLSENYEKAIKEGERFLKGKNLWK